MISMTHHNKHTFNTQRPRAEYASFMIIKYYKTFRYNRSFT